MSTTGLYTPEEIYRLLPALYRVRDEEHGKFLEELVGVISSQVEGLAESIEQMYDDQFIETCAEWVAPYIGDLIGYRTLHGVVPSVASPRAEVANTIRYRRRKGTVTMLEQLARDVTGWPARAVEFFELLTASQYMNHIRGHAAATASLRSALRLELGGTYQAGAFDSFAHTAEMRRVTGGSGRYNIPNVGIFLWRIQAIELTQSPLVAADGTERRYRFDALGTDQPLFISPRTEEDITHVAEPLDVPLPITRRLLESELDPIYGAGGTLRLQLRTAGGLTTVSQADIRVCNLSDDPAGPPGTWAHEPQPGDTYVAVDPVLGRVAFAAAPPAGEERLATFHHGSALEAGGGGYDRAGSLDEMKNVVTASGGENLGPKLSSVAGGGAVDIGDNERYTVPATITVNTPAPVALDKVTALRSDNRFRPLISRTGQVHLALDPDTTLVLNGLLLAGAPLVIEEFADARPRKLVLRHCTLVPGRTREPDGEPGAFGVASLIVLHPFTSVELDHCVVGPIVAIEGAEVKAKDSVLDACARTEIAFCGRAEAAGGGLLTVSTAAERQVGDGLKAGGHLELDACSVVGKVHAQRLDVSNSLFLAELAVPTDPWPAPVWSERRQVGCIRFSFVPPGSRTPRRFQCVGAEPAHRPHHTSLRYGDPGYMQLRRATHPVIRTGASDESEMGATHGLYQPQRETNLRVRLDEYLRYGLEAGFFYAT